MLKYLKLVLLLRGEDTRQRFVEITTMVLPLGLRCYRTHTGNKVNEIQVMIRKLHKIGLDVKVNDIAKFKCVCFINSVSTLCIIVVINRDMGVFMKGVF